jgi:hypothetical protein
MNMASEDEFYAVYGNGHLIDQKGAADLGNGGCNVILKDTGTVVGHWSSWEMASRALNRLQKLGRRFEYRLEESHHWVKGLDEATCSFCKVTRAIAASSGAPRPGW